MSHSTDIDDASAILKSWVEQYSERMYAWAYHRTSNRTLAEDLVQDTFLEAVRSFRQFKRESQPQTWLFSILNHKIIDHHRKQFRNPVMNQSSLTDPREQETDLDVFFDKEENWCRERRPRSWDTREEHLLDDPEFRGTLQHCMDALPAGWFSAVQLKYLAEKDGKEICQELGISPSNFWQILHRAKLRLRQCLENHWFKKKSV